VLAIQAGIKCDHTITSCIAMATCIAPYELFGVTNNVGVICVYTYNLQVAMCHRKKPLEASDTIPKAQNIQILMSLVL